MQRFRGQQGNTAVMVVVVVPGKEALTKGACVFDGAETIGELGAVLESFKLAL